MVEEIVAKIRLEDMNLGGGLGGLAGKGDIGFAGKEMAKSQTKNMSIIATSMVAGLAIWEGMKKGIQALVKASPALMNTLQIFKTGVMLLLKPIGDLFSMILRPFALAFIKWAVPFYRKSMERLATPGGKIGGVLGVIGGVAAGAVAGGAAGGALGLAGGPLAAFTLLIGAVAGAIGGLIGINVGAKIQEWGESLIEFFKGVDWEDFFRDLILFFAIGLPMLMIEGIKKLSEVVYNFWTVEVPFMMGYTFGKIINFFEEALPRAWEKFKDMVKAIPGLLFLSWKTVAEFIISVPKRIHDNWIVFWDWIKNLPQNLLNAFKNAWTSFIDGIKNTITRVVESFAAGFGLARSQRDDFVVTPSGIIQTNPNDYIIGTKTPEKLGGGGMTFAPTININAAVNTEMDIQTLAERIIEYSKDELTRRTNDFKI